MSRKREREKRKRRLNEKREKRRLNEERREDCYTVLCSEMHDHRPTYFYVTTSQN